MDNPISWKLDVEFNLNYQDTDIMTIVQNKVIAPNKDLGESFKPIDCYYYPGFILKFSIVRDPSNKYLKVFFPAMILGIFLLGVF